MRHCECAVKCSLVGKITKTSAEVYDEFFFGGGRGGGWVGGITESLPKQF